MSRALLILAILAAPTARAEPASPVPPAEAQSLAAFAAAHANCLEWSDTCVVCKRQEKGAFSCSTPGIACTPAPLACRDTAPPPAAPKDKP